MAGFKWEDPDNFADARKFFLKEGMQVISDMCKIARKGIDSVGDGGLVNHSDRKYVFEAMLPMLHAAKDVVKLDHLATMPPDERGDALFQAVVSGQISPQDAKNVLDLIQMISGDAGGDLSSQLVINLNNTPDTTLAGQVIEAMPELEPKID